MNMIGIEASSRHDLLDLRDRHSAGSRHVGIEVTSGLSIDEISFRISLPRLDDREVSRQRSLTDRSEEHTSELQSLMRISYAVFCLKQKKKNNSTTPITVSSTHKPIYTIHIK